MSKIKKSINRFVAVLATTSRGLAFTAMVSATLCGLVELPHEIAKRVVVNKQAVYVFASQGSSIDNQMRRERDDLGQHYISYAESERTPSRAGKF
jgi:hypothetical protein